MKWLLRGLLLVLFAGAVFGRSMLPDFIYWSLYFVMFALVAAYWFSMFWVGRKANERVLGKTPEFDIFAARVPEDTSEDLQRGRFSVLDGRAVLVQKTNDSKTSEVWSVPADGIRSIGFGRVTGARRGFTLYLQDKSVSFTCAGIEKHRNELYRALKWNFGEQNNVQK